MRISDICTRRVVTIGMDQTVSDARALFSRHHFHHVLVVEAGRLVGVISDRDLLKNLSPYLGTFSEQRRDTVCLERKIHQIMSRSLVVTPPETPISEAAVLMLNEGVSCLPVVEHGRPIGIVTWRDLLAWAVTHQSQLNSDAA